MNNSEPTEGTVMPVYNATSGECGMRVQFDDDHTGFILMTAFELRELAYALMNAADKAEGEP